MPDPVERSLQDKPGRDVIYDFGATLS